MGIKVAKFGGTSVADSGQIRKTADIIRADADRCYVVVSAPGKRFKEDNKITDLLYLVKTHLEQNAPYQQVYQVIRDRFMLIEQELGVDAGISTALDAIESELKGNPSADFIASRGEYLSAKITAAFLGYDFVDSADLVRFSSKGKFLDDETNEALKAELSKHERAVVPGFYGSLPDGSIKTFSRGGSDITGAVVAQAVQADVYENWTDVSGFLMADPRIVNDPIGIDQLSYPELRELSYMGASVLHENAIFPARQAGIPINIRNTNKPDDTGTMIVAETDAVQSNSVITGIAGKKDFTVIAIYKNMMSAEIGFIKHILSILEDYKVSVEHIPSGIDTVSVVIAGEELEGILDDIVDDILRKTQADSVDIYEHMALIATVGSRMARARGVSAKLFGALAEVGINVRMIDQGSSEMNIIVGVEDEDFEDAIRAIYGAFVIR
jgi:aspartate kinase